MQVMQSSQARLINFYGLNGPSDIKICKHVLVSFSRDATSPMGG